jgi:hypothetical protein
MPRHLHSKHVFLNPKTMARWRDIDRMFKRARQAIGMGGSGSTTCAGLFVTRARRAGVPESVAMRMSGHRTREVFERYNIVSRRISRRPFVASSILDTFWTKVDESATSGVAKP